MVFNIWRICLRTCINECEKEIYLSFLLSFVATALTYTYSSRMLFLIVFIFVSFQVSTTKVVKIERTTVEHDRRMHSYVKRENFSQAWGTQALQSTGIQHVLLIMFISGPTWSHSPAGNPAMSLTKLFPAGNANISISKLRIET